MNKLSNECIEAIEVNDECYYLNYGANRNTKIRSTFMVGATEALTNPSIYEKAGLISLEQLDDFLKWNEANDVCKTTTGKWIYSSDSYDGFYTTAQLFQIYQEQKEK